MTVATTSIINGPYVGNGASDTYSYTFRVTTKNELSVYETTDLGVQTLLVVDTHYTVNNIDNDAGGTVVRVAGNLPTDYQWYIRANYDEDQDTSFTSQAAFYPDVHEAQMDHITFLIQQLRDSVNRSIKLDDTIENDGDFVISEDATARADKLIMLDINGDITLVDGQPLRTDLASTANGEGASLIGVEDAAGNFTAVNVEAVLAEIISTYASTVTGKGASLVGVDSANIVLYQGATEVETALFNASTEASSAGSIAAQNALDITATEIATASNAAYIAEFKTTTNGEGASLIGIEDAAALFTATNAEAALAETAVALNVAESRLTTLESGLIGYAYLGAATTTVPTATETLIQYNTIVDDPESVFTAGLASSFTIPADFKFYKLTAEVDVINVADLKTVDWEFYIFSLTTLIVHDVKFSFTYNAALTITHVTLTSGVINTTGAPNTFQIVAYQNSGVSKGAFLRSLSYEKLEST